MYTMLKIGGASGDTDFRPEVFTFFHLKDYIISWRNKYLSIR